MSPHDVTDLAEQPFERWRRIHDECPFRVEQLADPDAEPASSHRHESVHQALRMAATTALRETEAAPARMEEGSFGCASNAPSGAVALADPTAWLIRRRRRSDGERQLIEGRRKHVVSWFVGGDVVVTASQVLDKRVTGGKDPS